MADLSSPQNVSSPPPPTDTPVNDNNDNGDEEDLMQNMAGDYKYDESQDKYDDANIDDNDYDELTIGQRREIEERMNVRDRRLGRTNRRDLPQALIGNVDDDDLPSNIIEQKNDYNVVDDDDDDAVPGVNIDNYTGPLREWLNETRVINEVKNRFRNFLTQYSDESGTLIYPAKIIKMCQDNRCSLVVDYNHLAKFSGTLGIWLADLPGKLLNLFDEVIMKVVLKTFPKYDINIHNKIHCRINGLPICDNIRELKQFHLNGLIKVNGVVTRRTNIFPQLNLVKFDCLKCGFIIGPFAVKDQLNGKGIKDMKPKSCPDCQTNGPFKLNETNTLYNNYQKIVLQESPGSVPAGRIPRSRDVILMDDLCDTVRPGEQIQVTGIYKNVYDLGMNIANGFPVFSTIIEANHILKEKDFLASFEITDDDKHKIIKLSKRMDLEEIILNSIAPSIYGYEYIKRSILYSLLGGQEKKHDNKHRVRGDINILILGDPGCGKSQFLKYIEKISSRAVYATGKGASAVGLTASVHRDPLTKEWTLEGGALVLADKGICLIDEFDKMNDSDRTSIHEAMEQQSISISKAGIVASLQARCAVIAAANPLKGRYDSSVTFLENVDLTDPILSRFDVLSVVRDKVEAIHDERLAEFVVTNHINSHPKNINKIETDINNMNINVKSKKDKDDDDSKSNRDNRGSEISQDFLKKYIVFAKKNCRPKLDNINRQKIASFYSDLRQKSMTGGGIPIAVRHIESILRLSEARAKLYLREYVNDNDVNMAIKIILKSFISTQKQSIQSSLIKHFNKYLTYNTDNISLLMHLLNKEINEELNWRNIQNRGAGNTLNSMLGDTIDDHRDTLSDDAIDMITIETNDFKNKAKLLNITSLQSFFKSKPFKNSGYSLIKNGTLIKKTFN